MRSATRFLVNSVIRKAQGPKKVSGPVKRDFNLCEVAALHILTDHPPLIIKETRFHALKNFLSESHVLKWKKYTLTRSSERQTKTNPDLPITNWSLHSARWRGNMFILCDQKMICSYFIFRNRKSFQAQAVTLTASTWPEKLNWTLRCTTNRVTLFQRLMIGLEVPDSPLQAQANTSLR